MRTFETRFMVDFLVCFDLRERERERRDAIADELLSYVPSPWRRRFYGIRHISTDRQRARR